MRLQIGNAIRPLNECVAKVSYSPIYDVSRIVTMMIERWDISGRIILANAGQRQMTAALAKLKADFSQEYVDLVFLEDYNNTPTGLALYASQCLQGPSIVRSGFPNESGDVYATGMSYSVSYEARRLAGVGSPLLEFEESVSEDPGGADTVWVGGMIGFAEPQIGFQHDTYKYRQIGSAVGRLTYPLVPPPIWPFAAKKLEPKITLGNPRVRGRIDTEFPITWEYEFEWRNKLYGSPNRR